MIGLSDENDIHLLSDGAIVFRVACCGQIFGSNPKRDHSDRYDYKHYQVEQLSKFLFAFPFLFYFHFTSPALTLSPLPILRKDFIHSRRELHTELHRRIQTHLAHKLLIDHSSPTEVPGLLCGPPSRNMRYLYSTCHSTHRHSARSHQVRSYETLSSHWL